MRKHFPNKYLRRFTGFQVLISHFQPKCYTYNLVYMGKSHLSKHLLNITEF